MNLNEECLLEFLVLPKRSTTDKKGASVQSHPSSAKKTMSWASLPGHVQPMREADLLKDQ